MNKPTAQHYEQAIEEFLYLHGGRTCPARQLVTTSYDWITKRAAELANAGDQRDREEER